MDGKISPRKTGSTLSCPLVKQLTDMTSGNQNTTLTPGGPVVVKGARLKFAPEDPEQGAFFMNETGRLIRVPAVLTNTFSSWSLWFLPIYPLGLTVSW